MLGGTRRALTHPLHRWKSAEKSQECVVLHRRWSAAQNGVVADASRSSAELDAAVSEIAAAMATGDATRLERANERLVAAIYPIAQRHQKRAWRPDGQDTGARAAQVLTRWWRPKTGPSGAQDLVEAYEAGSRGRELGIIATRKIRDAVVDLRREWDREHRPLLGYLEYKLKAVIQEEHDKGPGNRRLKLDPPPPPGTRNANRWVLLEDWPPDPLRRKLAVRAEPALPLRAEEGPDATGCSLPAAPAPKPKKGFRLHPRGAGEMVGWVECSLGRLDGTMRPAGLALRLFNLYDAGVRHAASPPAGSASSPDRRRA